MTLGRCRLSLGWHRSSLGGYLLSAPNPPPYAGGFHHLFPIGPVPPRPLVLRAPETLHRFGHRRRLVQDLGEAHHCDGVLHRDRTSIDLLEELDQLLVAAELGVVVLDVARGEL